MTVITGSDREIEYLLKREFPGYLGVQPQPITRHSLHVPITPEQEQARDALRQRIEKRRTELLLLKLRASNEFAALLSTEYAKEAQAAEAAQPFNQSHARADFDHWSKMAFWSLDEGIALCYGRDPRVVTWRAVEPLVQVSLFAKQFADAREIATRATGVNEIAQSNSPGSFIAWAKRVGLPFPAELEAKVAERGPIADWRTEYEQERAAHIATLNQATVNYQTATATIADLQRQLAEAKDATAHTWPWGTHETELLRNLAEAAQRFWVNYIPGEYDTAPNSDQVATWLQGQSANGRPIAERVAQIMAQILRADGLPSGRRK